MDLRKDTLFFDALVDFPTYGQEDKLYLDKANGDLYYWDGSAYALAGDGTGGILSIEVSEPLESTGGLNPVISIAYTPENAANKGVATGYASLDEGGKVPASQLPNSIMDYHGTYDIVTNTPVLVDGVGDAGDVYICTTSGTRNFGSGNITVIAGDWLIYNGTIWQKSVNSNSVVSVNGYTGAVSLTKSDIGLSNVDNTSDLNKPISTATQTALNGKENTITAGTTAQYYRGDKTFQTLDKSAVGLSNVDNTSDLNKPISTATQTALNAKQNTITLTTTGTSGAATLVGSTLNIPQYLGGLTYFTEAQNTAAPNATIPVDSLTAVASTTNADVAIIPKGTGAILAQIPDNTITGGNKRGAGAVDLQTERVSADQVASGGYSVTLGFRNKASNSAAIALGQSNSVTQANGTSIGYFNSNDGITGCTAIGWSNTITSGGNYGALAVGQQNSVSGQGFAIGVQNSVSNGCALGTTNTATAGIALGTSNTVNAGASTAIGKQASVFSIKGRLAHSAGQVAVLGDSQTSKFILQRRTTDATATTLISDAVASPTPFSNNQVILSDQSAYAFEGKIIGKQSGSTNAAMWKVEGLIVRGANAASTVLTASTVTLFSNLPGWGTPTLAADTTNGGLQVQVAGLAATNIQWTAVIETTEVIYA